MNKSKTRIYEKMKRIYDKNWKGKPLGRMSGKYNIVLHFTDGNDMVYRNVDSTHVKDDFYVLKNGCTLHKHPMRNIFKVYEDQNEYYNSANKYVKEFLKTQK